MTQDADRLARLLEALTDLAAGDFSVRVPISRAHDDLDAIALGVNVLAEEIEITRDELVEAARVKSSFLANMSHEVRTPMNAVLGMLHLIQRTQLPPRQRGHVAKAERAAKWLLRIIDDILDFSKMEAGKLQVERVPFRLVDVLDRLRNVVEVEAAGKDIELVLSPASVLPTHLLGDPVRLGQILINLVSNAVKFTERGTVTVRLGVEQWRPDEATLRFEVQDTGVGLTPSQMERLFLPFSQADASTTRRFGGTGLGLAISNDLCRCMGGAGIEVESTAGVGSTFSFSLPFGVLERHPVTTSELAGLRILIVDPEEPDRAALRIQLGLLGITATTTSSATEAAWHLDAAGAAAPYDLVLVDAGLLDAEGAAWAQLHRASAGRPPLLCVLAPHPGDAELDLPMGASSPAGTLLKPASASHVIDLLTNLFLTSTTPSSEESVELERSLENRRVLVVEDGEINLEIACELLGSWGLEVDVARTGAEAVRKVPRGDYDIVLMDIQMPEMDGLEATRRLRALAPTHPWLARLPILATTAHAMSGDREISLAAGMNDHVVKPIDSQTLKRTLVHWLNATRDADERTMAPRRAPMASLHGLRGFDVPGGLRRVAGNEALFRRLLRTLRDTCRQAPAQLDAAMASGDVEAARAMVHKLRGAAANLGAIEIARRAGEVEEALRRGTPAPLGSIDALMGALRAASEDLAAL